MPLITSAPGEGAVDARLATLMPITTSAPGGDAVDARLATLMPLTLIKVAFGVLVIFIKGAVG